MSLGRVVLAPPERRELNRRARKRSLAGEIVKRAEVILMLASGHSYREVRERLDCSDEYIREWKKRFTVRPIGAAIGWPKSWALARAASAGSGAISGFSLIGRVVIWPATILSLKRKPPTSLACTLSRQRTRRPSVSMKKEGSKLSTGLTRFCHSPPAEPNGMVLSIFVMARSHCIQRWILAPATSSVRRRLGIPASN